VDVAGDSGVESLFRPDDDVIVTGRDALAWQRDYVQGAGSPVAALILSSVIEDLDGDSRLAAAIPGQVRFGDLIGLRVMAAVHRLALERRAPSIALHLPTLGGHAPDEVDRAQFSMDVVDVLHRHPDVLARSLARTPQTNETGRAALLRCALSHADRRMPVRLREIGCSAGLNLRADHLAGYPGLEVGPQPPVLDRIGCDLHPVDPTTTEGRVHLTSYVWVDDVARYEKLRVALDVAGRVPATVVQQEAADFVESLSLAPGTTTVIWHSAMWLYLPSRTRHRVLASISSLGAQAASDQRLMHASWEWAREPSDRQAPFELVMRTWAAASDDGRPRLLATGSGHGTLLRPAAGGGTHLDVEPLPG
jgi:hypothetical protein